MCVMCMRVPAEARQGCKGLQLELQTTVRCLAWVSGTELGLLREQNMSLITVPSPQPHKNFFLWSREASPELWGCKNLLASVFCDGAGAGTPGMPLLLAHAKI